MPIYDYRCQNCGTVREVLVRRSDDHAKCPECGSEAWISSFRHRTK